MPPHLFTANLRPRMALDFRTYQKKNTITLRTGEEHLKMPGHALACPGRKVAKLQRHAETTTELPLVVLGTADRKEIPAIRTRTVGRSYGYAATPVGLTRVR